MKCKIVSLAAVCACTVLCGENPAHASVLPGGDACRDTCRVTVDFSRPSGPVKPLHGVNNAPVRPLKGSKVWEFEDAGIPYMRTHDTAGMWGGAHYVDIPNVFPNFDADENDPKNYDFAFTDGYLAAVVAAGTKIYYRLGVTIETCYRVKAYNIYPPKDFSKWARICEHIVRHYNEGWADGFKWGIEYWEVWNEPENPPLWLGTREQYFELYRVTANHLKKCFPDIKVGGYGSCGFYALDPISADESTPFQKSFLSWFEDFCKYVTDEKTKAPLDFYSWHHYVKTTPRRIVTHAKYVREKLDKAGLAATESHFNEWNYVGPAWDDMEGMRLKRGAACVGEAFCLMQRAPIDTALYYDALPSRSYCGLFNLVGKDKRTTTYHAFRLWNRLYRLGMSVESAADRLDFGVAAAARGDERAVFLVNNSPTSRVARLTLKGTEGAAFAIMRLDDDHDPEIAQTFDPSADLLLAPYQIAFVATSAETKAVDRGVERKVFAGQDSGVGAP